MIKVKLYGSLKKKYGKEFNFDARDAKECIRALSVQLDDFKDDLLKSDYRLIWGDLKSKRALDESTLGMIIENKELHIIPAASGAGRGAGKMIAGAALIGASFFVPGAGIAGISALSATTVGVMGATLALTGVAQALSPQMNTNYEQQQRPEQRVNGVFDGPVNRAGEGIPIPIVIGRVRVGSVTVSSGLDTEQL